MNGISWHVKRVSPYSPELVDRTGTRTVATTDPREHIIFLSWDLSGHFLNTVLIHELGHCAMVSFDLLEEIHRMVRPEYWVEAEEFICNFIADYGLSIFKIVYDVLGDQAMLFLPSEIERWIA